MTLVLKHRQKEGQGFGLELKSTLYETMLWRGGRRRFQDDHDLKLLASFVLIVDINLEFHVLFNKTRHEY